MSGFGSSFGSGGFGSGGFGSNNNNNNNNSGNSGGWNFGSSNNNNNNSGGFGSNNNSGSSGWGFGSNNNNNNNQNNQNNRNNSGNSWSFSNVASNWGQSNNQFNFSQPNNNQNNQNNNQNNNNFNQFNNNNNYNNNNNNQFNRNNRPDNPMNEAKMLHDCYDPSHPSCRFECILYNKVPKGYNKIFIKPNNTRIEIWENAIKNNPDPNNLEPSSVRGYKQLKERADLCLLSHVTLINGFQKMANKVSEISQNLEIKTKQEILDLKQTQSNLSYRLLTVLREYICRMYPQTLVTSHDPMTHGFQSSSSPHMQIAHISPGSSQVNMINNPLTDSEMKLKKIFESLLKQIGMINHHFAKIDECLENVEMNANNSSSSYNNRSNIVDSSVTPNESTSIFYNNPNLFINEFDGNIAGSIGEKTARMARMQQDNIYGSNGYGYDSDVVSQQAMKGMFEFLKKQQSFLANLKRTVQDDWDDLEIVRQGLMKHPN